MKDSAIEWTHHTMNPWYGCTRVSPGCQHCYAETLMDTRYHKVEWGPGRKRQRTTVDYWKQPLRWDRAAAAAGERHRVFCASLADVFDPEVPDEWRADLYRLIRATPNLDWLLLTKRPEVAFDWTHLMGEYQNIWLGTSVEDTRRALERIPILLSTPAVVRFLSIEPLLGPIGASLRGIDWVIVGGESGPGARPMEPIWVEGIRDYCVANQIPFHFKQWGGVNKKAAGRELGGRTWDELPTPRQIPTFHLSPEETAAARGFWRQP